MEILKINIKVKLNYNLNKFILFNKILNNEIIEKQIIKELITGDKMEREMKYKDPVSFIPSFWVTIVSNVIWDIKNQTSGLSRRIIYLPFENIPRTRVPNLLKLTTVLYPL